MDEMNDEEKMYLKDLMEEVLFEQYQEFGKLEVGSEAHALASKALAEQVKVWTEMNRVELEFEDRAAQRESDERMKERQMVDNRRTNAQNLLINGLFRLTEVGATLFSYRRMYDDGMTFEQTGVVTSHTFNNFLKSRKPNKL